MSARRVSALAAVGTTDPNTGDTITDAWNFGDPLSGANNGRTGAAESHVLPEPKTYSVTLTAPDGWGRSNTTQRDVTVAIP